MNKTTKKFLKYFLLGYLLWLLPGCPIYHSPTIKQKVVDSRTRLPINGAYIYAYWKRIYGSPGGQIGSEKLKEVRLFTGKDGTFNIPSYWIFNPVPYPFGQGGLYYVSVFAHGYHMQVLDDSHPPKSEVLEMDELEDFHHYEYNLRDLPCCEPLDTAYRDEDLRLLLQRYGNYLSTPQDQWELALLFEQAEDYRSAIRKVEEILQADPNCIGATNYKYAIKEWQKKLKNTNSK